MSSANNLGVVLIETPAIAGSLPKKASGSCAIVMVNNTLPGPTFQLRRVLGANLVVYSGTKYRSGFRGLLADVLPGRDRARDRPARLLRTLFGNILLPDECWMLDDRLPTAQLWTKRASNNAQRIAERLVRYAKVKSVIYPTLFDNSEQARNYRVQCDYSGAIFSSTSTGGGPRRSTFCGICGSRATRYRSEGSRPSPATPQQALIRNSPRRSRNTRGLPMAPRACR
jgi:cystathionine beta-lyase/cystathionine gamma-synthase